MYFKYIVFVLCLHLFSCAAQTCSGNGQVTNGQQLNPARSSQTSICVCNSGYAGDNCQYQQESYSFGDTLTTTVTANSQYFADIGSISTTGFHDVNVNVTSSCTGAILRLRYTCGVCIPSYPFQFSSSYISDFEFQITQSNQLFTANLFGTESQSNCGCDVDNSTQTWILQIDQSSVSTSCDFTIDTYTSYACPSTSSGVCNGGTCGASLCTCPSGRNNLDCQGSTSDAIELYNGFPYAKTINSVGNQPFTGYIALGITNTKITVKIDISTPLNEFLKFISVSKSHTTSNSTGLRVYTRFDEPPELIFTTQPLRYPQVYYDSINGTYDYYHVGTEFTIDIPVTEHRFNTSKMYVTVVAPGVYDVHSSNPITDEDIQFLLTMEVADQYASTFDIILIVLLTSLCFLFCGCWRCCPLCFHGCMRRVMPEIYKIERLPEDEHYNRSYYDNQVAELGVKILAVGAFLLYLLLEKCLDGIDTHIQLPSKDSLKDVIDKIKEWADSQKLPTMQFPEINSPVTPQLLLKALEEHIPLEMLTKKIKIPKTAVPKDLVKLLAHHIPDVPDLNISLISVKGFLMHLKRPELDDLIKRLDQLGLPLPMIHIPKVNPDFYSLVASLKVNLHGMPLLQETLDILKTLGPIDVSTFINDIKATIPINDIKRIKISPYTILDLSAYKLPDLKIEAPIITVAPCHCLTLLPFSIVGELFITFLDFLTIIFNISIIHAAFFNFGHINVPDLAELEQALAKVIGPALSQIVYIVAKVTEWIDIFKLLADWNCGGTITLLAPFVFLIGDVIVWIILQKDIVLWFGVKMKLYKADRLGAFRRKVFEGGSKMFVKLTLLILQLVVYGLAEAITTTTTTHRSCNSVDLFSNTGGKAFAFLFYSVFYIIFFFMFIGAPDWGKYKGMSKAKTGIRVVADGACRFMELSSGVWTDATVRAYNIIGRSTRYLNQNALKHRDLHESLHEQVMHLIAVTRIIIWVPLPLGIIACKIWESLNQSHIFIWVRQEHLVLRKPFTIRLLGWILHFVQIPLLLSTVLAASSTSAALLFSTLIPLYLLRVLEDIVLALRRFCACCSVCHDFEDELPDIDLKTLI